MSFLMYNLITIAIWNRKANILYSINIYSIEDNAVRFIVVTSPEDFINFIISVRGLIIPLINLQTRILQRSV